jgi:hypothetical protein
MTRGNSSLEFIKIVQTCDSFRGIIKKEAEETFLFFEPRVNQETWIPKSQIKKHIIKIDGKSYDLSIAKNIQRIGTDSLIYVTKSFAQKDHVLGLALELDQ